MHDLAQRLLVGFTSPIGVFILAGLDSTLFFSVPFGIDTAVIVLAAREPQLWWTVPLLATSGSVVGAAATFWMGAKIGDEGLERYVEARKLKRVRRKVRHGGAIALAALDLIPPPFPFTPFVLAAGALDVKAVLFFVTLTVCRLVRFGLEAALAQTYGPQILAFVESAGFRGFILVLTALAIGLTTWSAVRLFRSTRSRDVPSALEPPHRGK